jgi:DNA-binding transcriptional MerR regulator
MDYNKKTNNIKISDIDTGFNGIVSCKIVSISYRQLDYWARTGLVVPSINKANGSGTQRLYSFTDMVVLKVVKNLLDTGVSLQQIRKAVEFLRNKKGITDLSKITLMSDGATIYECKSVDQIYDLMRGGQGVFGIALQNVCKDVKGKLKKLSLPYASSSSVSCVTKVKQA